MRKINVIKAFNLSLPGATPMEERVINFSIGEHEVGTYERPIWTHEEPGYNKKEDLDQWTGRFETCEIADHKWVKLHCGAPLTTEELRAKAAKMKRDAAKLEAQAEAQAASTPEEAQSPAAPDNVFEPIVSRAVAPNSQITGSGVRPNSRQGYGA